MTTQSLVRPPAGPDMTLRECRTCGSAKASEPRLAGSASFCQECWKGRVEAYWAEREPLKVRTLHRNALAAEFDLRQGDAAAGRLLFFRDSMTLCVRFFTLLRGDSELVLEEALKRLLGAWPHGYLNVIIYPTRESSESDLSAKKA